MKQIKNWKLATVFDLEGDGLEPTLFHVFSFHMADGRKGHIDGKEHDRFRAFLNYHMDNEIPIVAHNGICFDMPTCERLLGIDLERLMLIDTVAISWYLNTKRKMHGLGTFLEDYGIPKPKVGECEWVIPIRGISLSQRKEGKGADEVKIITYKYLNESLVDSTSLPENYNKVGLDLESVNKETLNANESEEDYLVRVQEHKELMIVRCNEDVKINLALWQDFMRRLHEIYTITKACVDQGKVKSKRMSTDEVTYLDQYKNNSTVEEYIDRCLTFLMFKMDCARLQEKTRWKADVDYIEESYQLFTEKVETAKGILESVMPPVPKYSVRKKPKGDPNKKDGTPKVATLKWNSTVDQFGEDDHYGNPMVITTEDPDVVKLLTKYTDPNANSSDQLKSWLFSHGWVPETFEYVKDDAAMQAWVDGGFRKEDKPVPRKVPQINKMGDEGKELCHSVVKLAKDVPEVMAYDSYTVVKTRLDTIKGFRRSMSKDGYLKARIGAFTNTLRVGHRELANLAGIDKPYGENIRGSLTCNEGEILLGSDLSSLEDRVKHHFMLPHDPEYVATMMADDYDPHILTAHSAGMVSDTELKGFKEGVLSGAIKEAVSKARKGGKCTNYACLPVDNTEVLTDSGWKSYEELTKSDQVMSLNTETGEGEFTTIDKIHFFPDAEVVKLSHSNFEVESTKDHRWFVEHRKEIKGKKTLVKEFRTTENLNSESSILTSVPYVGGDLNEPDKVGILSWMLSDGYFKKQGNCIRFEISQSDKKYLLEIEEMLNREEITYSKRLNSNSEDVYILTLKSSCAKRLLKSLNLDFNNKHEFDYTKFILTLSKESLKSFYNCFLLADGLTSDRYKKLNYRTDIIYQNGGNILEAIKLCSELLGYSVLTTKRSDSDRCHNLNIRKSGKVGLQNSKVSEVFKKDVFCLTTPNSTFMIRQSGRIMMTGNCVYGGSPDAIARSAGIELNLAKQLHKGYWELNWSVKAIAEEQCVFEDSRKQKWLVNPVNGLAYSLRTEKDRFSTLCQGTGSFFFDMWVDEILTAMQNKWGKKTLTGSFHDEIILCFKDLPQVRDTMTELVLSSIDKVSEKFMLRRKLGADVQIAKRYSLIH